MPEEQGSVSRVLQALEDFFISPSFTTALGEFMGENVSKLQFVDAAGEQPLSNHAIYTSYQHIVEQQLSAFLTDQGVTQEALCEACHQAKAAHQSASLTCVDYLLACTEYEEFMQLAYDHQQLAEWEPEEGAEDDYELPPASDEEDEACDGGKEGQRQGMPA